MLAVIKAFKAFETMIKDKVVQMATDNATMMYYVNKQGVMPSMILLRPPNCPLPPHE